MESAGIEFGKFLQNVEFRSPRIKVLSNVTGMRVESPEEIKRLLAQQIVSPVLFEKCCHSALEMGISEFFECGPGRTLGGIVKKINGSVAVRNFDKIEDLNF
jgi:[acyl-carrier-protein] S-malonyltransferase